MTESGIPSDLKPALQTVNRAANAYGRADLAAAATKLIAQLDNPQCHMVVVGEFKQGKSSLVNALLNATLCPVDDDVATAVPTFIRFGDPTTAKSHRGDEVETLNTATLKTAITDNDQEKVAADVVEIEVSRQLLQNGLVLVDTPGVGGLNSLHGARTLAALNRADAVLFVSDVSQELTATEAEFLQKARAACSTIAVVMPKTDLYPHWQKIKGLTEGHLASLDVTAPVFPISSPLRLEALTTQSASVNAEAGYKSLVEWIGGVSNRSESGRVEHAVNGALDILHQLSTVFTAERVVLLDPETAGTRLKALSEANDRVGALRVGGGRWRQVLSDGIADISSEVSFKLREGLKMVRDDGTLMIDENNPLSIWPEFEEKMASKVQELLGENVAFIHARSQELAADLDTVFAIEERSVDISSLLASNSFDIDLEEVEAPSGSIAGTALTAVRGSYSGILMFNMMGGLVGITAIAPITIGLGVVLGIKALKGERDKRVLIARQTGKQAFRVYLDSATGWANKENQDAIKHIQRALRDMFTERLGLLQRTATEALSAAKGAAGSGGDGQATQLANVDAELNRIEALRSRLTSMTGAH